MKLRCCAVCVVSKGSEIKEGEDEIVKAGFVVGTGSVAGLKRSRLRNECLLLYGDGGVIFVIECRIQCNYKAETLHFLSGGLDNVGHLNKLGK